MGGVMNQRLRDLLLKDSLEGDLDAVVERVNQCLDEEEWLHGTESLADEVADTLLDIHRQDPNVIPEYLKTSLIELGHLTPI